MYPSPDYCNQLMTNLVSYNIAPLLLPPSLGHFEANRRQHITSYVIVKGRTWAFNWSQIQCEPQYVTQYVKKRSQWAGTTGKPLEASHEGRAWILAKKVCKWETVNPVCSMWSADCFSWNEDRVRSSEWEGQLRPGTERQPFGWGDRLGKLLVLYNVGAEGKLPLVLWRFAEKIDG